MALDLKKFLSMAFGKCKLFQLPHLRLSVKPPKPKRCPNSMAGMGGPISSSLYKGHNAMGIPASELQYVPGESLGG